MAREDRKMYISLSTAFDQFACLGCIKLSRETERERERHLRSGMAKGDRRSVRDDSLERLAPRKTPFAAIVGKQAARDGNAASPAAHQLRYVIPFLSSGFNVRPTAQAVVAKRHHVNHARSGSSFPPCRADGHVTLNSASGPSSRSL